jgi:ABC-type hemin transport system ATPase subunit
MNRRGKSVFFWALSGSVAALLSSCTTRSKAGAETQAAFLAGQNAALRQQEAQPFPGVTVLGPVQNPRVPWVAGLTLAQAIVTANYLDSRTPTAIIVTRQGKSTTLDPNILLNGAVIHLEPGDVVELRP